MLFRSRTRQALGLGLSLLALALTLVSASESLAGAKKADVKRVTFKSHDGVELSGDYYPNPTGKRDATVLLIHHFDHKKGGNRQKDGWVDLAERLQKDGYVVLSFDFRGFGDSKSVDPEFWDMRKNPQNGPTYVRRKVGKGGMMPTTIDHKDFNTGYYPTLVNDIAAARAFLDRQNDRDQCNSSNLIVIGSGSGATLGAMWIANECHRHRDKNPPMPGAFRPPPALAECEGKDIACGIFLSLSPSIGTRAVSGPLTGWLKDAVKNKIPVAFAYGTRDSTSKTVAETQFSKVGGKAGATKGMVFEKGFSTALFGSALLDEDVGAPQWILKGLDTIIEKRGSKERVKHAGENWRYFSSFTGRPHMLLTPAGSDVPRVNVSGLLK